MIESDDRRLVFLPENKVLEAGGLCMAWHKRWFVVCPKRGLVFFHNYPNGRVSELEGATPQCHRSGLTMQEVMLPLYPWADIKYFELVLQPVNVADFV